MSEWGWHCRKKTIGPYQVYHGCSQAAGLRALPSENWKATAVPNAAEAGKACDGDPFTRWSSLGPQRPGILFQLDLGKIYPVRGFDLELPVHPEDHPRRLQITGSKNGVDFEPIAALPWSRMYFSGNEIFRSAGGGNRISYRFPVQELRFLRLTQVGTHPVYYWSIYELTVFQ